MAACAAARSRPLQRLVQGLRYTLVADSGPALRIGEGDVVRAQHPQGRDHGAVAPVDAVHLLLILDRRLARAQPYPAPRVGFVAYLDRDRRVVREVLARVRNRAAGSPAWPRPPWRS